MHYETDDYLIGAIFAGRWDSMVLGCIAYGVCFFVHSWFWWMALVKQYGFWLTDNMALIIRSITKSHRVSG